MRQAGEGSDEAVKELVDQYGGVIKIAVRKHLGDQLRRQFDSDDFMQTIWKSFFKSRSLDDKFESPEKLGAFLARVARNKVVEKHRRLRTTQSYNLDREQTATDLNPDRQHDGIGPTATPSQIAVAKEEIDRILAGQPAHMRQAFELRVSGMSFEEIGDRLGFNKDSVRRMFRRAKKLVDAKAYQEPDENDPNVTNESESSCDEGSE